MADETRLEQIDVHVRGIAGMLQIQNSPLGFIRGVYSCNSLDPGTQMKVSKCTYSVY